MKACRAPLPPIAPPALSSRACGPRNSARRPRCSYRSGRWGIILLVATGWVMGGSTVRGQTPEAVVDSANTVLREVMSAPGNEIPHAMLADAKAIAIVPSVVKLGFLVGVRHGRGVLVVKDEQGRWKPPVFITITGGSFGWQAGIQAADLLLVFKTQRSIEGLMRGKLTLGADASVAAGPIGRQAAAATDATLESEIYSYSRSRGLFAGVALDGSAVQTDPAWNVTYYQGSGITPSGTAYGDVIRLPASAERLLATINAYTTALAAGTAVPADTRDVREIGEQLMAAAKQLDALLDDTWRQYLAIPVQKNPGDPPPTAEALDTSIRRFQTVQQRPDFLRLTSRPEFQQTFELLVAYRNRLQSSPLVLPPPPAE